MTKSALAEDDTSIRSGRWPAPQVAHAK